MSADITLLARTEQRSFWLSLAMTQVVLVDSWRHVRPGPPSPDETALARFDLLTNVSQAAGAASLVLTFVETWVALSASSP